MSARSGSSPLSSLAGVVVRRSAVAALTAGAMLGGTALTPGLLAPAAASELESATEAPPGEGAVGVLGELTDAGHKAVDAVGAAGGAVTDVVNGPAPAPAPAPVSEPPPRPAPGPAPAAPSAPVPAPPRAAPPRPAPTPSPPPQNVPPPPDKAVLDKAVPVQPAATTTTAPAASHSPAGPATSATTSGPEDHGKKHGPGRPGSEAGRGGSAGAGRGSEEQVSRSGSGRGGSGTNTATVASDDGGASVEDARAAVALLGEFLDTLDPEPTRTSSPATRTTDEHPSAGQSTDPRGEGPGGQQSESLAAGVKKLTEQAAQAAAADPDAAALLETITDPGLNLDDLDTTSSRSGSAGEVISRTSGSAAPAPEVSSGPAVQEPAAAGSPSSAQVAEKSAAAVPERVWDELAECESGGDWATHTGNGFAGGLQFTPSTWRAFGGQGSAHEASRAEQIAVAQRVQDTQGWGAWPACSERLGLTD